MPIPFTQDAARALTAFVDARPGLRMARAFGVPAGFAGRRMFACAIGDGLACRLPPEAIRRELNAGARPFAMAASPSATERRCGWVFYRPGRGALPPRLEKVLEEAVQHAAALSAGQIASGSSIRPPRASARRTASTAVDAPAAPRRGSARSRT
jgi:hypothetical protein